MKQIKGYKATNLDFTCRHAKYELNVKYTVDQAISPCAIGFHFCENIKDIFNYYNENNCRIFEVIGSGEIIKDGDKIVSSEITFVRELTATEFKNELMTKRNMANIDNSYLQSLCESYAYTRSRIEIYDNLLLNSHFDKQQYIDFFNKINIEHLKCNPTYNEFLYYASGYGKLLDLANEELLNMSVDYVNCTIGNMIRWNYDFSNSLDTKLYVPIRQRILIIDHNRTDLYKFLSNEYTHRDHNLIAHMIKNELDVSDINYDEMNPLIQAAFAHKGMRLDELIEQDTCDFVKIEILKHKFVFKYLFTKDFRVLKYALKSLIGKLK